MQSDDLGLVETLRQRAQAVRAGLPLMENAERCDELAAAIERLVAEARQAALGEDVANALLQRSRDHVDRLKEALTLADAVIDLGLDLISDRKGWGTYQRMEGVEVHEDADKFEKAAEAYRARQALKDAP